MQKKRRAREKEKGMLGGSGATFLIYDPIADRKERILIQVAISFDDDRKGVAAASRVDENVEMVPDEDGSVTPGIKMGRVIDKEVGESEDER